MHALLEVYLAGYIQGRPRVGQHPFIFISSRSHHEERYSYDPAGFYHEIFLAINLDKGVCIHCATTTTVVFVPSLYGGATLPTWSGPGLKILCERQSQIPYSLGIFLSTYIGLCCDGSMTRGASRCDWPAHASGNSSTRSAPRLRPDPAGSGSLQHTSTT